MNGWAHGDRATNEAFAPLETYADRFDALLRRVRALGFRTIDLWGAHLGPGWATDEHVAIAGTPCASTGSRLRQPRPPGSGPGNVERACELTRALGTNVIGADFSGEARELVPVLREHGVVGDREPPGADAGQVLAKIEAGQETMRATVDTGWWATRAMTRPVRSRLSSTSCTCT